MRTSESIKLISVAFLEVQKGIDTIVKSKRVGSGSFGYSYAELSTIVDQVYKKLNDNGIVVNQPLNGDCVNTRLTHTSGEYFEDDMGCKIICKKENDPQAYGSGITYARRYGLLAMLGIATEDDDGESAMSREKTSYDIAKEVANEATPQNDVMKRHEAKILGELCPNCKKGHFVKFQSGTVGCNLKCWLNNK